MEHVDGTPYRIREELEALGPERTRAISERMVDTLADLHLARPGGVGLGDFGRPEGFLARQVKRWGQQLAPRRLAMPRPSRGRTRCARSPRPPGSRTAPGIVQGDAIGV